MQTETQLKTFEVLRLDNREILARERAEALPGHLLARAIRSYLGGHASVAIRADGRNLMQFNCWSGNDCCDRESDPQLESFEIKLNPEAWLNP